MTGSLSPPTRRPLTLRPAAAVPAAATAAARHARRSRRSRVCPSLGRRCSDPCSWRLRRCPRRAALVAVALPLVGTGCASRCALVALPVALAGRAGPGRGSAPCRRGSPVAAAARRTDRWSTAPRCPPRCPPAAAGSAEPRRPVRVAPAARCVAGTAYDSRAAARRCSVPSRPALARAGAAGACGRDGLDQLALAQLAVR